MKKIILIFSLIAPSAYADINASLNNIGSDLNDFVNGLGFASNVTAPQAFESQAAGFFGGGTLYARNQVRQYQLVTLDLPSFRAGCGGIDLHTGSFSFISGDKLIDLGKSIMTNALGYGVDVMLATTVPELKHVRDNLQLLSQMANQTTINSCAMAQNLVGGLWPKTAASQQKICKDQGTMGKEGFFHDMAMAHMECNKTKGFDEAMQAAGKDKQKQKEIVLNKNLVWSLIKEHPFLSSNNELAEMLMSLTGTIIFDKNGKFTNVPSLVESSELIDALLGISQGKARIWKCTDSGSTSSCLTVKLAEITIPQESTLIAKVRTLIYGINDKLLQDNQSPTAVEKNFLNLAPFQIVKFLTVLNSIQYGYAATDLEEYATQIATNLLSRYLTSLLQEVANATYGSQFPEDLTKELEKRISKARTKIASIDVQIGRRLQEKLALINNIARLEKQVSATLAS